MDSLILSLLDVSDSILSEFFHPAIVFLQSIPPVWRTFFVGLVFASILVSVSSCIYFCIRCQKSVGNHEIDESEDEMEEDKIEIERSILATQSERGAQIDGKAERTVAAKSKTKVSVRSNSQPIVATHDQDQNEIAYNRRSRSSTSADQRNDSTGTSPVINSLNYRGNKLRSNTLNGSTISDKLLLMDKNSLALKCEQLLAERRAFNRDSLSFRKMFWRVALAKEKKRSKELAELVRAQNSGVYIDDGNDQKDSRGAVRSCGCCSCWRHACCCLFCHGSCCPYWVVLLCRIPVLLLIIMCSFAWTAHYWDPEGDLLLKILQHSETHLQENYGVEPNVQGYRLSDMFNVKPVKTRVGEIMCGGTGRKAIHPVVFIPGIISSGLELWKGKPCARSTHFRRRFWGTSSMLEKMATDRACWMEHMKLNGSTWDDPDGIHLRASSGLSAADYFMTGYYLWGPIIENLADCGYDETSMQLASYDWRLPFDKLEERDGYFSSLKSRIEVMHRVQSRKISHGKKQTTGDNSMGRTKVMVVSHSMGTPVWLYFMQWVENQEPGWIDREVGTWVNLAGSLLGAPKALTSALSGEMRDTAIIEGTIAGWIKDKAFPRTEMISFFRSLGSLPSLFPVGGEKVWGDGRENSNGSTQGQLLSFLENASNSTSSKKTQAMVRQLLSKTRYLTAESTLDLLRIVAPSYMSMVEDRYSFSINLHPPQAGTADQRAWANPTATALPQAPGLAIACLYGVGKQSELGYAFRETRIMDVAIGSHGMEEELQIDNDMDQQNMKHKGDDTVFVPVELDASVNNEVFSNGVRSGDGDGTVPLVSLGLMCVHPDLWKGSKRKPSTAHNPSGLPVRTREYRHEPLKDFDLFAPLSSAVQGGGGSADHVDILGNNELQRDLILMATSELHEGLVEDRIVSGIKSIAEKITLV